MFGLSAGLSTSKQTSTSAGDFIGPFKPETTIGGAGGRFNPVVNIKGKVDGVQQGPQPPPGSAWLNFAPMAALGLAGLVLWLILKRKGGG